MRSLGTQLKRYSRYLLKPFEWIGVLILWLFGGLRGLWRLFRLMFATTRGRVRWALALVIVLAILSGLLDYPVYYNKAVQTVNAQIARVSDWPAPPVLRWAKVAGKVRLPEYPIRPFRLGLDLVGGTQLLYDADTSKIPDSDKSSVSRRERC